MWKCKHCSLNFKFTKTADKANHSRWCNSNPNKDRYRDNNNLKVAIKKAKNKKYGEEKEYTVTCNKCCVSFIIVEREFSFPSKSKYFCSRKCANSHIVTNAHRKKTSESLTGRVYVPPVEVESKCVCGNIFKWIKDNKKDKTYCSKSCATKYNPKTVLRRQVQRSLRSELTNYRAACQFKFSVKNYPDEFNLSLIETHGWYKAKNRGNNLNGISRDHIVSVRYGFDNNIDPLIISHPANCRLLRHNDNVSKGIKSDMSLDELIERIKIWDNKYNKTN
jgi:hypothetical protein